MADDKEIIDEPEDIIKLQQEFYEMFGHKSSVIYDLYTSKESLEVKINLILPNMKEEKREKLAVTIWDQKKYTGDKCLLMSPVFVCCIYDNTNIKNRLKYPLNIKSKRFSLHPVFRIQKCLSTLTTNDQTKCCAIFVDEFARVYPNWRDFRDKNKYEDGLVVAPQYGIYSGSADDHVLLDIFLRKSGLTKNLDTGSTVVGLASAGVAAAAFIPSVVIAPAVLAGAAVAGISCAVYTGLRSAYDLYDRRNHKQTIALKDKDARSSWINLAAGTFTASAAGATQLITQAAQSGQNISHITRNTIRFINVGALSLHTTGCLDGFHTMLYNFYNGKPISKVHLAQLSASLFLLTHSIKNFQTAEQLMRACDSNNPESMKQMLCERQKHAFEHLVNETALIRGIRSDVGQIIVRSIKSLSDPKELLRAIEVANTDGFEVIEASEPTPNSVDNETIKDTVIKSKENDFSKSMEPTIISEYSEMFDKRLSSILTALEQQVKSRGMHSLRQILIHFLDELTLKAFNALINFVQELVVRAGRTIESKLQNTLYFECFLKIIFAQFVERAMRENATGICDYILSLTADKKQQIDYDIREYLSKQNAQSVEQLEKAYDVSAEYQKDLSDNRKVFLLITDRVEHFVLQFDVCCSKASVNDFDETIEDILKRLSYESATIFFSVAKKLLGAHAQNIQLSLGRFIPVDIFINDIYCLLVRMSLNRFNDVNEYLFQYTDEMFGAIEAEFKKEYTLTNDLAKTARCLVCAGEIYA